MKNDEPRYIDLKLIAQARRLVETSEPGTLRRIREDRGLTQIELAVLVGMWQQNLGLIENGKHLVPRTVAGQCYVQWIFDPRNEP